MILTPDLVKLRLKKLGIRSDKYLGQHFLIDQAVLDETRESTQKLLHQDDIIVEVGPGLGVLTQELVTFDKPVITIEKDPILAQSLTDFINKPNLTVIEADILRLLETNTGFPKRFNPNKIGKIHALDPTLSQIDDSICIDNPGSDFDWIFVANIPYGITSPLLRKLVELEHPPRHILVLMQKEVAERLAAKPGSAERGLLTVQIEIAGNTQIIQTILPDSFWPEPKVQSALVHIDLTKPNISLTDQERINLLKVVKAGFSAKRKQLQNSLAGGLNQPIEEIRHKLESVGIDPKRRAETLTLGEWQQLTKYIRNSV